MFCNECGAKNPDGSKFCNSCGAKIVVIEETDPAKFEVPIIKNSKVMPEKQLHYREPIDVSGEEINKLFDKDKEKAKAFMEEQEKNFHIETKEEKIAYENAYNCVPKEENTDDLIEYNDDLDDEDTSFEVNAPSVEDALRALSTSKDRVNPVDLVGGKKSSDLELIDDHYFDDVLPEIENEIYSIPKENIAKVIIAILGLIVIMGWLIYWLS